MPRCGLKRWLKLFVLAAGILLLPFLCVRQFLFRPFYIPTAGMQPTLMGATKTLDGQAKRGDSIMVDKALRSGKAGYNETQFPMGLRNSA